MNLSIKNLKTLLLSSFLLIISFGCNEQDNPKTEEEHEGEHEAHSRVVKLSQESIKMIGLDTESASLQSISGFISLPATIVANQENEAYVGSLIPGRVKKIHVKIGEYVKAGQVLMTLEGLDIGTIMAGFLKAKANLDFAKSVYERQKKLFDEKIGSQKTLLESQAEYEKALAEFKAEDKKIHSIGLTDDDVISTKSLNDHTAGTLSIKSPINGIIVERNVVLGQLIETNSNAFKVVNTSSVWIDGQVFEKDLNKINQKTAAKFVSSAYPDEEFSGKVIYIGQTIDEKSRTLLVRAEFANNQNKLKPQMFGELKIPVGGNSQVLMVPEEAVMKDGDRYFVFVRKSDASFEQRLVSVGLTSNKRVEIREGLKEGEIIVTNGVFYLNSEMKKEHFEEHDH